jgi:hypothetical protein
MGRRRKPKARRSGGRKRRRLGELLRAAPAAGAALSFSHPINLGSLTDSLRSSGLTAFVRVSPGRGFAPRDTIARVHLRPPSIDKGVTSFLWALVFFLILWLGSRAVGVSSGTAFILSAVAAFGIFFYIRLFSEERPR